MNNLERISLILDSILKNDIDMEKEYLTDETNLKLTGVQLMAKISKYSCGHQYIKIIKEEFDLLSMQKLISIEKQDSNNVNSKDILNIPDWNRFMSSVNSFYEICGPY